MDEEPFLDQLALRVAEGERLERLLSTITPA
jgi:hypothetical protein